MSADVLHQHGRRVHRHPSVGVQRHLYAPRASRALTAAPTHTTPPAHGHARVHDHDRRRDHGGHADRPALADEHGHAHGHGHEQGQAHSHGLVDATIARSRAGVRTVGLSLGVLAATSAAQALL